MIFRAYGPLGKKFHFKTFLSQGAMKTFLCSRCKSSPNSVFEMSKFHKFYNLAKFNGTVSVVKFWSKISVANMKTRFHDENEFSQFLAETLSECF